LADRIGIIHQGKLIQELSTIEVEKNRRRSLKVIVRQPESAQQVLIEAGYHPDLIIAGTLELFDPEALESPEIVATKLVLAGQPPLQLIVDEEDLEQYFLRLVGGKEGKRDGSLE
jgi:ABC-2 type transport system ATP-binding protein